MLKHLRRKCFFMLQTLHFTCNSQPASEAFLYFFSSAFVKWYRHERCTSCQITIIISRPTPCSFETSFPDESPRHGVISNTIEGLCINSFQEGFIVEHTMMGIPKSKKREQISTLVSRIRNCLSPMKKSSHDIDEMS